MSLPERYPVEPEPGQESHDIGSAYCVAGCADQYLVSDHHRYSQSDGSDRIGFFGCRREDYSVCHAASDGNLIGSSDDDGTELRSRTYTTDEPLSASGIGIALVFGVSVCVYSQFLPETLTAFFTKDAAVVSMAAEYLRGYSIDCIVVSFVFCINSYFSGQGNSLFPMIHSLIATFLFRIPLSYWFSQIDSSSLFIMGFAPPVSTVVSLLICIRI